MSHKTISLAGFAAHLRRDRALFLSVLGLWLVLLLWQLLFPENVARSRAHGLPILLWLTWPIFLSHGLITYLRSNGTTREDSRQ